MTGPLIVGLYGVHVFTQGTDCPSIRSDPPYLTGKPSMPSTVSDWHTINERLFHCIVHRPLQEECEQRGATIIYATHIFDGLESWPTHLAYLARGEMRMFKPAEEVPELKQGRLLEFVYKVCDVRFPMLVCKWEASWELAGLWGWDLENSATHIRDLKYFHLGPCVFG